MRLTAISRDFHCVTGLSQSITYAIPNDLLRIGVCHQRQVAEHITAVRQPYGNVSDITNPQADQDVLIAMSWLNQDTVASDERSLSYVEPENVCVLSSLYLDNIAQKQSRPTKAWLVPNSLRYISQSFIPPNTRVL